MGKPTNFVTQGIITETEQKFGNPKWYFSYYGDVFESEPLFARWLETQIGQSIIALHVSTAGAMAAMPLLGRDIDQALRRIALVGYYLGGRRFTKEMSVGLEVVPPKKAEDDSEALRGEVSEEDFLDPDPDPEAP
jgi:hypothetical protein